MKQGGVVQMEQDTQSSEVGDGLHSYNPLPERLGWGLKASAIGAWDCRLRIMEGLGAGDGGFQFWKCHELHLENEGTEGPTVRVGSGPKMVWGTGHWRGGGAGPRTMEEADLGRPWWTGPPS